MHQCSKCFNASTLRCTFFRSQSEFAPMSLLALATSVNKVGLMAAVVPAPVTRLAS